MAALPCNLPGHVDGWMRKLGFHLLRILAAEPRAEDGFATDEARWRYEMAVLGPKMEFELLRHQALAAGRKCAQGLGAALPPVRAMLPPMEQSAWRTWDGGPLLASLRDAVDARSGQPASRRNDAVDSICGVLEHGRIPAAKAALHGERPTERPPPTLAMQAELQAKNPPPESLRTDVVSEAEWRAAADVCERRRVNAQAGVPPAPHSGGGATS